MSTHVDLSVDQDVDCPLTQDEVVAVCDLVLREEGVERTCFVSVTVVDDARIREINQEWRGQDRPTDVVSLECERPDDPDLAPGEPCELGDIVLAPAYIARQAQQFLATPADEFRLLLVHGMLHLLGYDHLEEDEARRMEQREDELAALAAGRPMGHTRLTRHSGDDAP